MKGLTATSTLAVIIGFSGYCFAAGPEKVSHEQAAKEAVENRNQANELWDSAHQACAAKDKPKMFEIMRAINAQSLTKPTNHLNYSARFVYSSCQQMFLDVSFINGACVNKPPMQHEIDYVNKNWKEDSSRCDAEITNPDLSQAESKQDQTEKEWEAEQRKNGESDEDIAFMKQIRNS